MSVPTATTASASHRANSFDALRLFLAAMVVYSHAWLLGGFGSEPFTLWVKRQVIAGEIGVIGFFGLSGFLVAGSFERSRHTGDFLVRRARRIFPGLWACLAFTALVITPLIYAVRHHGLHDFLWVGPEGAFSYIGRNLALLVRQWSIAGVLDGAPYGGSLNGSLWSLSLEFGCYLGLAGLGLAGALSSRRWLLVLVTAILLVLHGARTLAPGADTPLLPAPVVLTSHTPFVTAFLVGACIYVWRALFAPGWPTALTLAVIAALLLRWGGFHLFQPLLVPLLVIQTGLSFSLPLRHDYSYGLYIYGFPVQQALATWPFARSDSRVFFTASLVITLICAMVSWHWIEKPVLRRTPTAAA